MKHTVEVTNTIEVEVPDDFFTEEFMADFRKNFYDYYSSPHHHIQHLALLHSEKFDEGTDFIEGYGNAKELGIRFVDLETRVEIV